MRLGQRLGHHLPNVTAAGLDLSGMTQAEAEQAINESFRRCPAGWLRLGRGPELRRLYRYAGRLIAFRWTPPPWPRRPCLWDAAASSPGAQYLRHLFGAWTLVPIRSN